MTRARDQHTDNILIGAGEVHFDEFDADGNKTGERYLGDAVGATLAITTEETSVFSGTGAVAQQLANIPRTVARVFNLNLHDISLKNLALFVIGDMEEPAAVADEVIEVAPGRGYQLGVSEDNPAGYSLVADVAVTGGTVDAQGAFTAAAGNNAWASGTDYEVDAAAGRIAILETENTKVDGAAIQVDYTPASRVKSSSKQVRGAFRYIEDPAEGEGRNFYAPDCRVRPNGELALLDGRNTEQQIALAVTALEPGGGLEALYIDGRPK